MWKKNRKKKILLKAQAYSQTVSKTPLKFQKDRPKTVV